MSWKYLKKMYIPAISIITVVLIIFIILFISTRKNLDREKEMMTRALLEKGDIIIMTVDAFMSDGFSPEKEFTLKLTGLMNRVSNDPDILHVYLVSPSGDVVLQASREGSGEISRSGGIVDDARIRDYAVRVIEDEMLMEMGKVISDYVVVVGLSQERLWDARKKDMSHSIFMGVILLILGTASIYFVFVVQNFYVVERSLERMRSYMGNVVDSMPGALITVDPEGKIVTVNKAAKRLLNLEERLIEDKEIGEIVKPEDCRVYDMLERHGRAFEIEGEATLHGSGEKIPIAASASMVLDSSGKNIGSVFILRDLVELRSCQARLIRSEKLAIAGTLSMAIAHEIRNPMSSIRGFAHYFKRLFASPSREREYLDLMISEIDRVNGTITDLLKLSKPKAPVFERGSISEAVSRAVNVVRGKADEAGVCINMVESDGIPEVAFDGEQVHQALLNLLINAVEATPTGGRIDVTAELARSKERATIEIVDTGPGIEHELMSRIFDPFLSGKEEGTGLGLAVVQQVVDLHGWHIDVLSERGIGTTFIIEIPLIKEEVASGKRANEEGHTAG